MSEQGEIADSTEESDGLGVIGKAGVRSTDNGRRPMPDDI